MRVSEEDPHTGERNECCHAYLTFVSLRSLRRTDNPDPKVMPPPHPPLMLLQPLLVPPKLSS